eukprot:767520-Hanusia_phi.AAC.2
MAIASKKHFLFFYLFFALASSESVEISFGLDREELLERGVKGWKIVSSDGKPVNVLSVDAVWDGVEVVEDTSHEWYYSLPPKLYDGLAHAYGNILKWELIHRNFPNKFEEFLFAHDLIIRGKGLSVSFSGAVDPLKFKTNAQAWIHESAGWKVKYDVENLWNDAKAEDIQQALQNVRGLLFRGGFYQGSEVTVLVSFQLEAMQKVSKIADAKFNGEEGNENNLHGRPQTRAHQNSDGSFVKKSSSETGRDKKARSPSLDEAFQQDVQEGVWIPAKDPVKGKTYFWNSVTKQSVWKLPKGAKVQEKKDDGGKKKDDSGKKKDDGGKKKDDSGKKKDDTGKNSDKSMPSFQKPSGQGILSEQEVSILVEIASNKHVVQARVLTAQGLIAVTSRHLIVVESACLYRVDLREVLQIDFSLDEKRQLIPHIKMNQIERNVFSFALSREKSCEQFVKLVLRNKNNLQSSQYKPFVNPRSQVSESVCTSPSSDCRAYSLFEQARSAGDASIYHVCFDAEHNNVEILIRQEKKYSNSGPEGIPPVAEKTKVSIPTGDLDAHNRRSSGTSRLSQGSASMRHELGDLAAQEVRDESTSHAMKQQSERKRSEKVQTMSKSQTKQTREAPRSLFESAETTNSADDHGGHIDWNSWDSDSNLRHKAVKDVGPKIHEDPKPFNMDFDETLEHEKLLREREMSEMSDRRQENFNRPVHPIESSSNEFPSDESLFANDDPNDFANSMHDLNRHHHHHGDMHLSKMYEHPSPPGNVPHSHQHQHQHQHPGTRQAHNDQSAHPNFKGNNLMTSSDGEQADAASTPLAKLKSRYRREITAGVEGLHEAMAFSSSEFIWFAAGELRVERLSEMGPLRARDGHLMQLDFDGSDPILLNLLQFKEHDLSSFFPGLNEALMRNKPTLFSHMSSPRKAQPAHQGPDERSSASADLRSTAPPTSSKDGEGDEAKKEMERQLAGEQVVKRLDGSSQCIALTGQDLVVTWTSSQSRREKLKDIVGMKTSSSSELEISFERSPPVSVAMSGMAQSEMSSFFELMASFTFHKNKKSTGRVKTPRSTDMLQTKEDQIEDYRHRSEHAAGMQEDEELRWSEGAAARWEEQLVNLLETSGDAGNKTLVGCSSALSFSDLQLSIVGDIVGGVSGGRQFMLVRNFDLPPLSPHLPSHPIPCPSFPSPAPPSLLSALHSPLLT